jgi:hypothetical protein
MLELTWGLGRSTQFLSFLYFCQSFAVYAHCCRGAGFQTLDTDFYTAGVAIAVVIVL